MRIVRGSSLEIADQREGRGGAGSRGRLQRVLQVIGEQLHRQCRGSGHIQRGCRRLLRVERHVEVHEKNPREDRGDRHRHQEFQQRETRPRQIVHSPFQGSSIVKGGSLRLHCVDVEEEVELELDCCCALG
jgi:hypothetical protein